MSSAFIRSTIEVRHASFSCLAAAGLSTIAATSTLCGAAAGVDALGALPLGAGAAPVPPELGAASAGATPPVGAAVSASPKIAILIFLKMLIICSQKDPLIV